MSVLIRTDGNSTTGLGHLMRCLALAQELQLRQVEVLFVIREASKKACLARHDWVGKIVTIPDFIPQSDEPDWIAEQDFADEISLVVLDGYQFDSTYRKELRSFGKPLVVFDDNNNSGSLYADAVINGAANSHDLNYSGTAPDALLLTGEQYRVLRQEFLTLDKVAWHNRHSICIVMGGSDPSGITLDIVKRLGSTDIEIPVRVIIGSAYRDKEVLRELIAKSSNPIQLLENCQDIAEIFNYSRLAISAGGSTQFELHATATPTIFLTVADNQRFSMEQQAQQKWCRVFDALNGEVEKAMECAVELYLDDLALQQMHEHAIESRDTHGVVRVVDALQTLCESEKYT